MGKPGFTVKKELSNQEAAAVVRERLIDKDETIVIPWVRSEL